MKAIQWIDRVKQVRGWESDYKAAQELGLTRSSISLHRSRGNTTLDEDSAVKVAELLGVDPVGVILDQVAERSKSPAVASALHDAARRFCILCKVPNVPELIAVVQRLVSVGPVPC